MLQLLEFEIQVIRDLNGIAIRLPIDIQQHRFLAIGRNPIELRRFPFADFGDIANPNRSLIHPGHNYVLNFAGLMQAVIDNC